MGSSSKLFCLIGSLLIITQNLSSSLGATVDQNGGYDIVVAVSSPDYTPNPESIPGFLNNIENALTTFSTRMWAATHSTFFIRNAEIVLPPNWNYTAEVSGKSFGNSDIRISSQQTAPYVENPNPCGLPGDYLELPRTFFDTAIGGTYGEHWKVLLASWARYRWGVFEEHGIPGDSRFPYFIRAEGVAGGAAEWVPNGCTDAPNNRLVGEYKRVGNNNATCDPTSAELDVNCRFFPSTFENTAVTSSLMNVHFLDSVSSFCDETTHQHNVPTKQNIYCDRKSVMEVIRSTRDFKTVTAPLLDGVPLPVIKVSKAATRPALYILLDKGLVEQADALVINEATAELGKLLGDESSTIYLEDLIVGVGHFPSEVGPGLVEDVPLGLLRDQRVQIIDAIGNHEGIFNADQDFGIAIQQAVTAVRKQSPSEGGNILLVKVVPAAINSQSYELENTIVLRQSHIKLFAIEVKGADESRVNLGNLTTVSGGKNLPVKSSDTDLASTINTFLQSLEIADPPVQEEAERITWRGDVEPTISYGIPVLANTEALTFHLVTAERLNPAQIVAGFKTGVVDILAPFTESTEYAGAANVNNRFAYTGVLLTPGWTIREALFEYPGAQTGHLLVLSKGATLEADITVEVFTSSLNGNVDLGDVVNSQAPFTVSTSVRQGLRPVIDARVIAVVESATQRKEVVLLDSGSGNPDINTGDGIYAEVIIPPTDGVYTVTVSISKDPTAPVRAPELGTRLLPPSQNFPRPPAPIELSVGVTKTAKLERNIVVTNSAAFVPSIQTIRDFGASVSNSDPGAITFNFHLPQILTQTGENTPAEYRVYSSVDRDALSGVDLTQPDLPAGVTLVATQVVENPSHGTAYSFTHLEYRPVYTYYAVAAWNAGLISPLSSVIGLDAGEPLEDDSTTTEQPDDTTTEEAPGNTSEQPDDTTTEEAPGNTSEEPGSTSSGPGSGSSTEQPGNTSQGPGSTSEAPAEDNKPWLKTTGGIVTIVVIVLVCFAAAGGGYWYMNKRRAARTPSSINLTTV